VVSDPFEPHAACLSAVVVLLVAEIGGTRFRRLLGPRRCDVEREGTGRYVKAGGEPSTSRTSYRRVPCREGGLVLTTIPAVGRSGRCRSIDEDMVGGVGHRAGGAGRDVHR